jgi:Ca2+-transporting ATPase
VNSYLEDFARKGLRVLGVGRINFEGSDFPKTQQEFKIEFLGLLGFYDPPKKNIAHVFEQLYDAGIQLKIITGDNPVTTSAIAKTNWCFRKMDGARRRYYFSHHLGNQFFQVVRHFR